MRVLTHIEVGNFEFCPTQEDLNEMAKRFESDGSFVETCIAISQTELPIGKFKIIVDAGDSEWHPTREELDFIKNLIDELLADEDSPVLFTRNSVRLTIFEIF